MITMRYGRFFLIAILLGCCAKYACSQKIEYPLPTQPTQEDIRLAGLIWDWQILEGQKNPDLVACEKAWRKIIDEPISTLPSLWRKEYIEIKCMYYSNNGLWDEFQKMEQELNALLPGDLYNIACLHTIAEHYDNNVFSPPKELGIPENDRDARFKYFKDHYYSGKHYTEIHQYIVDHYDHRYFKVYESLEYLGISYGGERGVPYSLETYFTNRDELFSIPGLRWNQEGAKMFKPAEEVLKDQMKDFDIYRKRLEELIVKRLSVFSPEKRDDWFLRIMLEHEGDPRVKELYDALAAYCTKMNAAIPSYSDFVAKLTAEKAAEAGRATSVTASPAPPIDTPAAPQPAPSPKPNSSLPWILLALTNLVWLTAVLALRRRNRAA